MFGRTKREMQGRIDALQDELDYVKDALGVARVCRFIKVVSYKKGEPLKYVDENPLISLEDLEKRIVALEKRKA